LYREYVYSERGKKPTEQLQAIADELIHLEVVHYITDSTVCDVMKKMNLNHGL